MLIRGEIREVWMLYNPLENHLLPFFASFIGFHLSKIKGRQAKGNISEENVKFNFEV